jgi:hypothetical protein
MFCRGLGKKLFVSALVPILAGGISAAQAASQTVSLVKIKSDLRDNSQFTLNFYENADAPLQTFTMVADQEFDLSIVTNAQRQIISVGLESEKPMMTAYLDRIQNGKPFYRCMTYLKHDYLCFHFEDGKVGQKETAFTIYYLPSWVRYVKVRSKPYTLSWNDQGEIVSVVEKTERATTIVKAMRLKLNAGFLKGIGNIVSE